MQTTSQDEFASYAVPFAAGAVAWLASQFMFLLAYARAAATFVFGADVAEFMTRSYVITALAMITVACIQQGVKLFVWWCDNRLRRERDALLQQNKYLDRRLGQLETSAGR